MTIRPDNETDDTTRYQDMTEISPDEQKIVILKTKIRMNHLLQHMNTKPNGETIIKKNNQTIYEGEFQQIFAQLLKILKSNQHIHFMEGTYEVNDCSYKKRSIHNKESKQHTNHR
jgi:hypothetical protein